MSQVKTTILGKSQAAKEQMEDFLSSRNPHAPNYAGLYLSIGDRYGVRGDLAFCQSLKETGYWRFGGSVKPEQNNFCGLGAISRTVGGASFPTPEEGIEAQIQHLYGYATSNPLPAGATVVDPRFDILVKAGIRGSVPHWEDLNGKWAVPGTNYGEDIVAIWRQVMAVPIRKLNWKEQAVQWLKDEQLITSDHDPDANVTWAELGVVLRRLSGK